MLDKVKQAVYRFIYSKCINIAKGIKKNIDFDVPMTRYPSTDDGDPFNKESSNAVDEQLSSKGLRVRIIEGKTISYDPKAAVNAAYTPGPYINETKRTIPLTDGEQINKDIKNMIDKMGLCPLADAMPKEMIPEIKSFSKSKKISKKNKKRSK